MSYEPQLTVPRWVKVTKTFTDFSTAGLTNDIEIFSLPAKSIIISAQLVPTTAFTGGLIATYTVSVGKAGALTKYAIATDVFTGFPLPSISGISPLGIESTSGATSIRAQAISTVGNLNAATTGSIDIYLLISNLG